MITLFLTALIILGSLNSIAQEVKELKKTISTMENSADAQQRAEAVHICNLIYNLQPKIYLFNETKQITGKTTPVCADVDIKSVKMLKDPDPEYNSVEILTIRLNEPSDLTQTIKLSELKSFTSLKYVYIVSNFHTTPQELNKVFFRVPNTKITVFYEISAPK